MVYMRGPSARGPLEVGPGRTRSRGRATASLFYIQHLQNLSSEQTIMSKGKGNFKGSAYVTNGSLKSISYERQVSCHRCILHISSSVLQKWEYIIFNLIDFPAPSIQARDLGDVVGPLTHRLSCQPSRLVSHVCACLHSHTSTRPGVP